MAPCLLFAQALKLFPVRGMSVILADVRGRETRPVYDQFPLGIQKCHFYEYLPNEVVVRHHNNIGTIGVWRTSNESAMKWIKGGG